MKNALLSIEQNIRCSTNDYCEKIMEINKDLERLWDKVDMSVYFRSSGTPKPSIPSIEILDPLVETLKIEIEEYSNIIKSHQKIISKLFEEMSISLDNYPVKRCDYCKNYFDSHMIKDSPERVNRKKICDSCFDENFFVCCKCGKTFLMSKCAEEDEEYGYYCSDCAKPLGFPETVIIAPDFPYCENVAFSNFNSMNEYVIQCGNLYAEISDTIELRFKEKISKNTAKYKSSKGVAYEVGELNHKGHGSMREIED